MKELLAGVDKKNVAVTVSQVGSTGDWAGSSPSRRILDTHLSLVSSSWDWGTTEAGGGIWSSSEARLYCLFDSTAISDPGMYYVQLKLTIGTEIYSHTEAVSVKESSVT